MSILIFYLSVLCVFLPLRVLHLGRYWSLHEYLHFRMYDPEPFCLLRWFLCFLGSSRESSESCGSLLTQNHSIWYRHICLWYLPTYSGQSMFHSRYGWWRTIFFEKNSSYESLWLESLSDSLFLLESSYDQYHLELSERVYTMIWLYHSPYWASRFTSSRLAWVRCSRVWWRFAYLEVWCYWDFSWHTSFIPRLFSLYGASLLRSWVSSSIYTCEILGKSSEWKIWENQGKCSVIHQSPSIKSLLEKPRKISV